MNVYIATKFENVAGFKQLQGLLEAAGHKVIYDWTEENFENDNHGMEREAFMRACAVTDLMAVMSCEALIFLPTKEKMAGAFVELGLALGRKHVILVDPFAEGLQTNVFYYLPQVEGGFEVVKTMEEAVAKLAPATQPNPETN